MTIAAGGDREVADVAHAADIGHARSGEIRIAYQVVGDGPLDLVLVHGWVCSFQPGWENPKLAGFYRRLASMGRLILFDKRGTGLSDRVSPDRLPDLETRMDDVRAVMDAVGSERAVVLGISEGGADVGALRRDPPSAHHGARSDGYLRADDARARLPDRRQRGGRRRTPRGHRGRRLGVGRDEGMALPRRARDPARPGSAPLVHLLRAARREPGREQGDPADERRDRRPARAPNDQRADARALSRGRVLPRGRALHGRAHSRSRRWSSSPAPTTCRGRATGSRWSTRSSSSSPDCTTTSSPTTCSPPCSSPTSRHRPRAPATAPGTSSSRVTTGSCARSSRVSGASRSRAPATDCWRRSTVRPARFDAPRRSWPPPAIPAPVCGRACTPGRSSGRFRRARHRRPDRGAHRRGGPSGRGARVEHCQGHRRGLGHQLRRPRASTSWRVCRAPGGCSPPRRERPGATLASVEVLADAGHFPRHERPVALLASLDRLVAAT